MHAMRGMKAAIIQMQASTDKDKNLDRILSYIARAASRGAALCAFPEFMMFYTTSSQTPRQLASLAEPITGDFVNNIAAAAKEHRIEVVGSFYEKSKKKDRVYDTCFIASKTGRILSKYQKIHLYDALGFRESAKLVAGSRLSRPVNTSLGKTGMMICYDLRFPEVSRLLAAAGSGVLVAPSAWVRGPLKEEHWITINRTRAIENGCYVIAPDQVGNIYCGRSLAVDPYGRILVDMKKRRAMSFVEVDPGIIKKTRRALPLLANRRPAAYKF